MSSSLLFAAGGFITFITLWGVVMAGGFYAAHRQDNDNQILEIVDSAGRSEEPERAGPALDRS